MNYCICGHKEAQHGIYNKNYMCDECIWPAFNKKGLHIFKLDNLRYLEELSNGRE